MSFINECTLMGNLGDNPSLFHHDSGSVSCKVSLATQDQSAVQWHRVLFWGRLAEVLCQYATKGDKIYVSGQLRHYMYKDLEGNKRHRTEVVVRQLKFIHTKRSAQNPQEAQELEEGFTSEDYQM